MAYGIPHGRADAGRDRGQYGVGTMGGSRFARQQGGVPNRKGTKTPERPEHGVPHGRFGEETVNLRYLLPVEVNGPFPSH